MIVKEIKDIPIDDIEDNPYSARRFEEFDKEDIKQLSKSFEKSGMLQPIVVREKEGGKEGGNGKKYQLIAGGRRKKAVQLSGKDTIQAKIVEADDIEVRIMSLAENYHRRDLTVEEREKSIYDLWNRGNQNGIFKNNLSVMEEWTGIPHQILSDIVNAGKEKEEDQSEEIQLSTSKDLQRTRSLKDIPDVRKELLKGVVTKQTLKVLEMESVVKIIKNYIDYLSPDILFDISKFIVEKKLKVNNLEDFITFIISIEEDYRQRFIDKIRVDERNIDIYELKELIGIYNTSYDDVKEGILNKNITIGEAKNLNFFDTRAQREKVLVSLRNYDKEIEYLEKQKVKYVKDMLKKITIFDLDEDEKEEDDDDKYTHEEDNKIIKRIMRVRKDLIFFNFEDIDTYDPDTRQKAVDMVWEVYEHYFDILVELGELD